MRVARSYDELVGAVASAQREAAAAFGDGTVFLERYVDAPRHIEVQIIGDAHGHVAHLFERECSIQRRFQKVIEEAPSPAVDEQMRRRLGSAALTAARAIGYVGAGTVEFVVDADGSFFFLEVNTRLQVEHPVTEEVTGLDLVRLQIVVAQGEELPAEALAASVRGHAIEARLYAEDVGAGFLPVSGTIERLEFPAAEGLRVDAGVTDGSTVSTHYDAMLAKVIAWAPTRREAARRLADALAGTKIHGTLTNRDLLVRVLRHPAFGEGRTDTGFLDRHAAELATPLADAAAQRLHALSAALAARAERRARALVQPVVPAGWRNVGAGWQRSSYVEGDLCVEVGYRPDRQGLDVQLDGHDVAGFELWSATPDTVALSVDGVRRMVEVHRVGATAYVDSTLGSSALTEVDRFPLPGPATGAGSLRAPMPGSVVRVHASPGQSVDAGETLIVLEAMKMEHALRAPCDGVVTEVAVDVGQQVETGAVLAVVKQHDVDQDGNSAA